MSSRSAERNRNYFQAAVFFAAFLPVVVALISESEVPTFPHALIATLWVLCLFPAYKYFGTPATRRRPIPFLPTISVLYGVYYALPLTLGITDQYYNAPVDPHTDYEPVVELAFFGWLAMMGAYAVVGQFLTERSGPRRTYTNPASLRRWAMFFVYAGLAVSLIGVNSGLSNAGGILQFILSLQWLGIGTLAMLWRQGHLSRLASFFAIIGGLAIVGVVIAGGAMAPLVMLVLTIVFGLWIGSPKIPAIWVILAIVAILFATSVRGVAIEFRRHAWFGNVDMTRTERMMYMLNLLQVRARDDGVIATVANGIETTGGRSANLDLFANVARRTPSEVPYWNGQTYLSLVGALVPRVFWPDKPTKEVGQAFGHRYRLIYYTNTSTAINLPFLVEFFLNFSMIGLLLGMIVVGAIYRIIDSRVNRVGQDDLTSLIGMVLVLPLLMLESDFSLVFGGLPLNAVALFAVWSVLTGRATGFFRPRASARVAGPHRLPILQPPPRLESR